MRLLNSFEKQGGRYRAKKSMTAFRFVLQDCDPSDLDFTGQWFTWEQGWFASTNIQERFDRGVTNSVWWNVFPKFSVTHLNHSIFDRCQIMVNTREDGTLSHGSKRINFMFNTDWCLEESCEHLIQEFCDSNKEPIPMKLERLGKKILKWSNFVHK